MNSAQKEQLQQQQMQQQDTNFDESSPIDQEYFRGINFIEKTNSQDDPKKKKPISIDSFNLLSIIGKGSYAKVSLVRKKDDEQVYALKAIKKSLIKAKNQREHVITERNILQSVNNQYIVKLKYAFQDAKKIFFALEYCGGGELYGLLSSRRYLNELQTKFYSAQLVKALEYLHSINIIYRDLKPENVLIDKDGYIKLTDFGLSKMNVISDSQATSLCGTPEYLAPEILEQKGHGKPADWWTLGNIIWEMMIGLPPFFKENRKDMFNCIKNSPLPNHHRIQGDLKNLLLGLLEKDPNKRLGTVHGAKEIIDHPWFKDLRWDQLEQRKINPPFVPNLDSEIDVKFVDCEFKDMSIYSNDNSSLPNGTSGNSTIPYFTVESIDNRLKCSPQTTDNHMDAEGSYEQIMNVE